MADLKILPALALALVVLCASRTAYAGDAADIRLFDGFDAAHFAPGGGLYYKRTFEQLAGSVVFESAVTYSGAGALKLTVRSHCPATKPSCSERAEIWERPALRVPYDEGVWYGLAARLGQPIPTDDHRYLIAQWKREIGPTAKGDFSPFFALRLDRGRLFVTAETEYHPAIPATLRDGRLTCPEGMLPALPRKAQGQMRVLIAHGADWSAANATAFPSCTDEMTVMPRGSVLPEADSGWIDFAIYSRPGATGDGHMELFANGGWIATVTGHIGHDAPGLGPNQYFKFGPYRAPSPRPWSVYYDDFRRSPSCRDVLHNARACELAEASIADDAASIR